MIGVASNYFAALAANVAARTNLRSARLAKLRKPVATPRKARVTPLTAAERMKLAYGAFPNHDGNYLGKREPSPPPRALTPNERFARLAGEHECRARDYRWKRARSSAA